MYALAVVPAAFLWALPNPSRAACANPLATVALHPLDSRIDVDPTSVLASARQRLGASPAPGPLEAAELQALVADAASLSDDDEAVHGAVAAARAQLAGVADSAARRSLEVRLDLTAADSSQGSTEISASIEHLNRLEQALPPQSLDRACLLVVRSRLEMQVVLDEDATSDGLEAYRLATALGNTDASADAAQQLAYAYLHAGLLEDAESMVRVANAHYETAREEARLSNGLYVEAEILRQLRQYQRALAMNAEVRALNARAGQAIDVGLDDAQRCSILLSLQQLESARQACMAARAALGAAGRFDLAAPVEGDLARIELVRGRPAAAVARLDAVLGAHVDKISTKALPALYRQRSEALDALGRYREALRDLQEAARLVEASNAAGHSLAAARQKERASAEAAREERQALQARMQLEREQAANSARQSHLELALALAAATLLAVTAYFLWKRARQERALRTAAQTLESQAQVISTVREGVLLVDRHRRVRYANPAAARLFGRSREQLLGCDLSQLGIRGDCLPEAGPADARPADGGPRGEGHELQLPGADGQPLSILLSCSPISLQDDALTVCVLQDVTELRHLERRLFSAASEEREQLGSEIHDHLLQELSALSLVLKGVSGRNASDASKLQYLDTLVGELIEDSRALVHGLAPVRIGHGSLPDALARLAEEQALASGVRIACRCAVGDLGLGGWQADHLFRIARGCTYLALHDRASGGILIELQLVDDALELSVSVERALPPRGLERESHDWGAISYLAKVIGGTARAETLPAGGLRRLVAVPLRALAMGSAST